MHTITQLFHIRYYSTNRSGCRSSTVTDGTKNIKSNKKTTQQPERRRKSKQLELIILSTNSIHFPGMLCVDFWCVIDTNCVLRDSANGELYQTRTSRQETKQYDLWKNIEIEISLRSHQLLFWFPIPSTPTRCSLFILLFLLVIYFCLYNHEQTSYSSKIFANLRFVGLKCFTALALQSSVVSS